MLQITSTPIKETYAENSFEEGDLSISDISSAYFNESNDQDPFEPSLNDSQQVVSEEKEQSEYGKCGKRKFSEW